MRSISAPFVVARPSGAQIKTRLRLSAADQAVVGAVGEYLGRLAGADLAGRCRLGRDGDPAHGPQAVPDRPVVEPVGGFDHADL
jgi:hypothetical protein